MTELGEATWIPNGNGALYGWVHRPADGHAKGAVIIAPPLGREQVISYRTLRVLAITLAQQGWVAIRFGWTGTAESAPMPTKGDVVAAWQRDLQSVQGLAREIVGTQPVHAIGLRTGASILATAPLSIQQRLLWEPVGGRLFLRQQSMLRTMSLPHEPTASAEVGIELNGTFYLPHQAAALAAIPDPAKAPAESLPPESQIVREKDPNVGRKIYAVASIHAIVPVASLQVLIDLLAEPAMPLPQSQWSPIRQASFALEGTGSRIVEEIVEVGPDRLPGVYCRPFGAQDSFADAAFFVAASAEPKDGVTALWVAAARRLAARGIPALRTERRGSGDLGWPEALMDPNPYTLEAIEDTENTAAWLQAESGASVTGFGLCVGAWLIGMASEHSPIDRVVMLNNVAWRPDTGYFDKVYAALNPSDDMTEILSSTPGGKNLSLKSKVKEFLREKGPYPLWRTLGRRSIANTPEVLMEIASRQAEVLMYFGPEDYGEFTVERGQAGLTNLLRSGRALESHQEPALDHALMGHTSRLAALRIIDEVLPSGHQPRQRPDSAEFTG